jgi:WD40 repeat protein
VTYKAFISYSRAVDASFADALHLALQRFAKPWNRRHALEVFRDKSDLSASAGLWPSISRAIDESEFFILVASPRAASSPWVRRELAEWRLQRPAEKLLIAVAGGELWWHDGEKDFDWSRTTALPADLRSYFSAEPLWCDFRPACERGAFSLTDEVFQDGVATLAATLHDRPKRELIGEDLRQHRRALRLARSAIALLSLLFVGVMVAATVAFVQRGRAEVARGEAVQQTIRAETARVEAENQKRDAVTARREAETQAGIARQQARIAEQRRLEAERQARFARSQSLGLQAVTAREEREYGLATSTVLAVEAASTYTDFESDRAVRSQIELLPEFNYTMRVPEGDAITSERYITGMAFSDDGRYFAAGSANGKTWIIDMATGKRLAELIQERPVRGIAFHPGSRLLAAMGDDGVVETVQSPDWHKTVLVREADPAHGLAFSPDGLQLSTGRAVYRSADGAEIWRRPAAAAASVFAYSPSGEYIVDAAPNAVRIYRSSDGGEVHGVVLNPERPLLTRASAVAFSADSHYVGASLTDGRLYLALTRDWKDQWIAFDTRGLNSFAFSRDRAVAVAGEDGTARVLRGLSDNPSARLYLMEGARVNHVQGRAHAVAFSPSGGLAASVGLDGYARVFNVETGSEVWRLDHGLRNGIESLLFNPDGSYLATATAGGNVQLYSVGPGKQVLGIPLHEKLRAAALDERHGCVAIADRDLTLHCAGQVRQLEPPEADARAATFSHDGAVLAASGGGPGVLLYDVATGKTTQTLPGKTRPMELVFSNHDRYLAVNQGGKITVFDLRSGTSFDCRVEGFLRSAAFSSDDRLLAVGGEITTSRGTRGVAVVLDLASRRQLDVVPCPQGVHGVALSPDGHYLGILYPDLLRVIDRRTGKEVMQVNDRGSAIRFSPSGRWLGMEAWNGGSVRLFQVSDWREMVRVEHLGTPLGMTFSADESTLLTASLSSPSQLEVRRHPLRSEAMVREVCARAGSLPYLPGTNLIATYRTICGSREMRRPGRVAGERSPPPSRRDHLHLHGPTPARVSRAAGPAAGRGVAPGGVPPAPILLVTQLTVE